MELVSSSKINHLYEASGAGPRLAWLLWVVCAPFLPSCWVTTDIDFPVEEQIPPTITDYPGAQYKISDILVMTAQDFAVQDFPLPPLQFRVIVRDPNVDEVLFARWRLTGIGGDGTRGEMLSGCEVTPPDRRGRDTRVVDPGPEPTPEQRTEDFTLDTSRLPTTQGCYRLELVVSGSFTNRCTLVQTLAGSDVFGETDPLDNKAEASWLLLVDDETVEGKPDVSGCRPKTVERDDPVLPAL